MRFAAAFLSLWLIGLTVGSAQGQSLYGPGGLFLHPSADVPPQGQLTVGGSLLTQRIPPTPGFHTTPTWGSVSLDYGVTRDMEIGLTSLAITDFEPSYGGSFKYRFLHESSRLPAMAAGFTFSGFGDNNSRLGFVALRKQLNTCDLHPVIGHLGLLYIHQLAGLTYNQFQPYAGVELGLVRHWTLIGEVRPRGKSDFKVSTALSLAYEYGRGNRVVLTWANSGQSTEPRFGFGVGLAIGRPR